MDSIILITERQIGILRENGVGISDPKTAEDVFLQLTRDMVKKINPYTPNESYYFNPNGKRIIFKLDKNYLYCSTPMYWGQVYAATKMDRNSIIQFTLDMIKKHFGWDQITVVSQMSPNDINDLENDHLLKISHTEA